MTMATTARTVPARAGASPHRTAGEALATVVGVSGAPSYRRLTCRLCDGRRLDLALTMTPGPPVNLLVTAAGRARRPLVFPLDVYLCGDCGHLQLRDVVDRRLLFADPAHVGDAPAELGAQRRAFAETLIARAGLRAGDLVVDIGAGDGGVLALLRKAGLRVLGVEPASAWAHDANRRGIETLAKFFSADLARDIRQRHGPARAIIANQAFAGLDDLADATDGVRHLLADGGRFVFEVPYLVDVFENGAIDAIQHVHLDYHRIGPLGRFLARHRLTLFDAERSTAHGGTLRGWAAPNHDSPSLSANIARLGVIEQRLGLSRLASYQRLADRIEKAQSELIQLLTEIKGAGGRVVGYGASVKARALLQHLGLGADVLDCIVDERVGKQELFTPGSHVPVVPVDALRHRRPDYLLVLAWHQAERVIARHPAFAADGGRFIVPLPEVRVR